MPHKERGDDMKLRVQEETRSNKISKLWECIWDLSPKINIKHVSRIFCAMLFGKPITDKKN